MQRRTAEKILPDLLMILIEEFHETEQLHPSVADIIKIDIESAGSLNRNDPGFLPVFLSGKSGKSDLFSKGEQSKNGKKQKEEYFFHGFLPKSVVIV